MRVCERNNALGGDIEGHDGDILRWNGFWSGSSGRSRCGVEHLIERNYAVRKLAAEAADEANGEDLRRNVDDDLAVIDGADAADACRGSQEGRGRARGARGGGGGAARGPAARTHDTADTRPATAPARGRPPPHRGRCRRVFPPQERLR